MNKEHAPDNNVEQSTGNQLMQDDEARYFLASIIGTLQDSVVTVNREGRITSWNKAAERLYGYSASEAIGRSLQMVTFPTDFTELLTKIEAIMSGETVALFDTLRLHKEQHTVHIEVTLSPVINNGGRVIGVSICVLCLSQTFDRYTRQTVPGQ